MGLCPQIWHRAVRALKLRGLRKNCFQRLRSYAFKLQKSRAQNVLPTAWSFLWPPSTCWIVLLNTDYTFFARNTFIKERNWRQVLLTCAAKFTCLHVSHLITRKARGISTYFLVLSPEAPVGHGQEKCWASRNCPGLVTALMLLPHLSLSISEIKEFGNSRSFLVPWANAGLLCWKHHLAFSAFVYI